MLLASACGSGTSSSASGPSTAEPTTTRQQATGLGSSHYDPAEPSPPLSLKDRLVVFASVSKEDFSVEEWVAVGCRRSLGLVADSDPLLDWALRHRSTEVQQQISEPAELSPGVFLVEVIDQANLSGTEEIWVFEEDAWRIDICGGNMPGYPVEMELTGEPTIEGLQSRIDSIDQATSEGSTGIYPWLSQRCRVSLAVTAEDYVWLLLLPIDDLRPDDIELTMNLQGAEVVEMSAARAEVTPISTSTAFASGRQTDRWVHEFGNWFYDGCPTESELQTADQAQLDRLLTAHATVLDLEIDGLISTGFYDTDINGPLERVLTYESISDQVTWWDAQTLFIETLIPQLLSEAGYEVITASGQRVQATSLQDPSAKVDVHLESPGGDTGVHYIYLTIRYR